MDSWAFLNQQPADYERSSERSFLTTQSFPAIFAQNIRKNQQAKMVSAPTVPSVRFRLWVTAWVKSHRTAQIHIHDMIWGKPFSENCHHGFFRNCFRQKAYRSITATLYSKIPGCSLREGIYCEKKEPFRLNSVDSLNCFFVIQLQTLFTQRRRSWKLVPMGGLLFQCIQIYRCILQTFSYTFDTTIYKL